MKDVLDLFQVMYRRFGLLNKNCCSTSNEVDLSLVESHILYEINKQQHPSMQQIAETLDIDITTFSRKIQKLIKLGLVNKNQDVNDKRTYILSLTEQGEKVNDATNTGIRQNLESIFCCMTDEEQNMVIESIQLLNNKMKDSVMCCRPLSSIKK